MKLIFKDQAELNTLLGFLDADIKIEKIKSDLYTASRELSQLVGKEVYDYALSIYDKAVLEGDEAFLLYSLQYPIAINGYRMYAPSGDLNHTNNGRKMRNGDNEKSAFEWQINRDNEALEKRYYKALDTLLELLDETNPVLVAAAEGVDVVKWKDTEAFLKTHKLFVRSIPDFEESFSIQSRLLLLKLQPGFLKCEREEILPRLGTDLFNTLKENARTANQNLDTALLAMVKSACVYYALAWGMKRLRVALMPEGVLQKYSGERVNLNSSKVPEKLEAESVIDSFESDAENAFRKIEAYLKPAPSAEEIELGQIFPDSLLDGDCNQKYIST